MTWGHPRDALVIALGIVAAHPQEGQAIAKAVGADAELKVQPGWDFLGFDVADGTTSGLSNCGYDEHQLAGLRRVWAPRLNHHGLFRELTDALAFRWLTNKRVPEHAPFYVYALWVVPLDD